MKKACLITFVCSLCCINASLWTGSQEGYWDDSSNWDTGVPNAPGADAEFGERPWTQAVDSESDITIGQLHLEGALDIQFTNHSLTFQTNSLIDVAQGNHIINTPIVIKDDYLKIKGNPSSNLSLSGNVSGPGGLDFENGNFVFSGNNSYGKQIYIKNAILHAGGTGCAFPKSVTVLDGGQLFHDASNLYSQSSNLFVIDNSYVDFGNTTQTILCLHLSKGTIVGANATLTLLNQDRSIHVKSESVIGIKNLVLPNGGYLQLSSIRGVFDGSLCQDSFMTLNLNGKNLNLDAHHPDVFPEFAMGFNNVVIANGSVAKIGLGRVFFSGQLGSIPTLSIQNGEVYIGMGPTDIIDSSGDLTVENNGCLGGLGTLGRQGDSVVTNQGGIVRPGTGTKIGMLRISGSYSQSPAGTLVIKAANQGNADRLVVENGVSLDGALILQALPGSAFHAGDQIVILDNSQMKTPMSGKFSSFSSTLPPDLNAEVQYDNNQVTISITQK